MFDIMGGKEKHFHGQGGVFAECEDVAEVERFAWPELKYVDFTDSFALEITLSRLPENEDSMTVLLGILGSFLEAGGSTLQLNLLDPELLTEAQKHPEQHRDLLVRVCGYSASFVQLDKGHQDEIIAREIRMQ